MNKQITAMSTLIGTIVGAGVLGVPYVFSKSGFILGMLNMILIAILISFLFLYLGEISLRTKTRHQLTGYASLYLGKTGKKIMFIAFSIGIYSSLIAYLIGESKSLSLLLFGTNSHIIPLGVLFWLFLTILTSFGLKTLEKGENIGVASVSILVILSLFIFGKNISLANLAYNNLNNFYVPFGVLIFAFLGFASIPEINRILDKEKKSIKKVIIISLISVFIIYTLFAIVVLGSQGTKTPEIATFALGKIFVILGMFTMFTSYLALSTALIDTFNFDYKIKKRNAWAWTNLPPLIIFLILALTRNDSFIKIIGLGGAITGTLVALIILLMINKAKKLGKRKPEYSIPYSKILATIIAIILIIGTILEISTLF